MKRLSLSACLAATAAFAAELKDPAAVAQEWNQTVEQRLPSPISPTLSGLIGSLAPLPPERSASFTPDWPARAKQSRPSTPPPVEPAPDLGPRYDAPSRPPIRRLPPEIPDNAVPWLYRDQTYWLVPLGGAPD